MIHLLHSSARVYPGGDRGIRVGIDWLIGMHDRGPLIPTDYIITHSIIRIYAIKDRK